MKAADNPGVIATHRSQKCLCLLDTYGPADGVLGPERYWPDPKEQAMMDLRCLQVGEKRLSGGILSSFLEYHLS